MNCKGIAKALIDTAMTKKTVSTSLWNASVDDYRILKLILQRYKDILVSELPDLKRQLVIMEIKYDIYVVYLPKIFITNLDIATKEVQKNKQTTLTVLNRIQRIIAIRHFIKMQERKEFSIIANSKELILIPITI